MAVPSTPAGSAFEITPSDSTEFESPTRSVYVGTAGDLSVDMADTGSAIPFVGVPAGTVLPIRVRRVRSTGTTADNIIGLY